jgi:DNA-binding phage protein
MPLTRSFKSTVLSRVQGDRKFRDALLGEAVQTLLAGDLDTGKSILRDYINATLGFAELAEATGTPSKSLMRMFSPKGNPQARHLLAVIHSLQERTGVRLKVQAKA